MKRGNAMASSIMTIRPPDELRQQLKQIAHIRGLTVNALILQILWDWVKQNNVSDERGREA